MNGRLDRGAPCGGPLVDSSSEEVAAASTAKRYWEDRLPIFDVESPEGHGVLVALGWTGNWLAEFKAVDAQLEAQAGMPLTKFRLHPGERVRGPRVLCVLCT